MPKIESNMKKIKKSIRAAEEGNKVGKNSTRNQIMCSYVRVRPPFSWLWLGSGGASRF